MLNVHKVCEEMTEFNIIESKLGYLNHINYFYIVFPKVRCSLEDVADNMVSSQLARGEKESMVIRALCETLSKTGSSSEIVATTMMSALKRVLSETKSDCDIMKAIGNTMHEQGTESEYIFVYTVQSFRKERTLILVW